MKSTSRLQLRQALLNAGLAEGQLVLCHSSLICLGRMEGGAAGVVSCFRELLGPSGTLITPTFTYSAFAGEVFDIAETRSAVGGLGDAVRTLDGAVRSHDPNFSHAGIGPHASELLAWREEPSIGPGSFYSRFSERDGRVVLLGVDFRALPFFMHMERVLNLPYRYDKRFQGQIRHDGKIHDVIATHAVRDEKTEPVSDRSRIGELLDRAPDCRTANAAYGKIRIIPINTVERLVREQVGADPLFLLNENKPFEKDFLT